MRRGTSGFRPEDRGVEGVLKAHDEARSLLRGLFAGQRLAVLATQDQGQPHTSLVAFAASEDLRHLVFATPRSTRKYAHLSRDPRVALLIDNRSNEEADFQHAVAVTAAGTVRDLEDDRRQELLALYTARHPGLEAFVRTPTTALLDVAVTAYFLVTAFQNVLELRVAEWDGWPAPDGSPYGRG